MCVPLKRHTLLKDTAYAFFEHSMGRLVVRHFGGHTRLDWLNSATNATRKLSGFKFFCGALIHDHFAESFMYFAVVQWSIRS